MKTERSCFVSSDFRGAILQDYLKVSIKCTFAITGWAEKILGRRLTI